LVLDVCTLSILEEPTYLVRCTCSFTIRFSIILYTKYLSLYTGEESVELLVTAPQRHGVGDAVGQVELTVDSIL